MNLVQVCIETENLVDFVEYDDKTPWPECADGNGYSLELNAWNSDNELAESWACVNEYGSPGRENIFVLSKDSNEDYKISLRNNPVNDIIEILEDFSLKAKNRAIDITLISERGTVKNPESYIEFFNLRPQTA